MSNDNLKKVGLVVLALFAVFLMVYAYQKLRQAMAQLNMKTATEAQPGRTTPKKVIAAATNCSKGNLFPLSVGSCGGNVRTLQAALNKSGKYQLDEDGIFGNKTLAAVQSAFGSSAITKAKLNAYAAQVSGNTTTSTGGNGDFSTTPADTSIASISSFATALKTDLDTTYFLGGRRNEGVYAQTVALSDSDLKAVAKFIQDTYGESLYNLVKSARWNVTDNVDILIKNRLTAVGYGIGSAASSTASGGDGDYFGNAGI